MMFFSVYHSAKARSKREERRKRKILVREEKDECPDFVPFS